MLPSSSWMVMVHHFASPYDYYGPFGTQESAEKFIEDRKFKLAWAAELKKP